MENTVIYNFENPMPDEKFTRLFSIMERAFPPEEHGTAAQHRAEFSRREFHCLCYEPEGAPAGFMSYYRFAEENVVFLEHFAVDQELRGNGVGSRLMRYFKEIVSPALIVLEVEPPEGEAERRRIGFYQRMGFVMNQGEYFQPDFNGTDFRLPLKLMSTAPIDGEEFQQIKVLIHKRAYNR